MWNAIPAGVRRGACALALPCLAGCASYTDQTQALRSAWTAGNFPSAAQIAQNESMKSASKDVLLWDLEAGAASRAATQTDASLAAFSRADGFFDYWDNQPEISLTGESVRLLVNPTVQAYRGTGYDRIMESTYQALNYLQLGRFEEARVELNRALERQRQAVNANAARLEKARQAAAESAKAGNKKASDSYDVERAQADPSFKNELARTYGALDALRSYAPYVNPFTTYLQGLTLLARPQSPSDLESARVDLDRVREMIGGNPYIDADCELIRQMIAGAPAPDLTYVIYETGMAPVRDEARISIPLFVVSPSVPYVGVAFPQLRFNSQFNPGLTVRAAGSAPLSTELLCDMDAVIGQEFRNELPNIIVKTLLSAGAKAAAQYGVYEATKAHDNLRIITEIIGILYQDATNHADLRTWVTLPKQFVFCRFPTPADRKLELVSQSNGDSRTVDLPPGHVTLVYAKSTSFADRLVVQTLTLH